jgi:carotenoid 1,2-hydratase
MTERGRDALDASPDQLRIGPSSMRWTGRELIIDINEISSLPLISRVQGQITITPRAVTSAELLLTPDGAHVWRPFAPASDIRVELVAKGWQWSGHGYFDANFGIRPLEQDFKFWTWGRFPTQDGAVCIYDAERRDGSILDTAISFGADGKASRISAPPRQDFARSAWRIRRETRADPGHAPRQVMPMLDAPFYTRAAVQTRLNGQDVTGVHEALDLDRFAAPIVKAMLAFRIPRRR